MELESFKFHTLNVRAHVPDDAQGWSAYLRRDNWDDWGKYATLFYLTLVNPNGEQHHIGQLKVGQRDLKPFAEVKDGCRTPKVPSVFKELEDDFFSLGQDEEYYANLNALGDDLRMKVLTCLRDVALDNERWEWAKRECVMGESLLRDVTRSTVVGQFRRMAHGDARVTPYSFTYLPPKRMGGGEPPYKLDFDVDPESPIPSNVHVLIGRNGVGKTQLLLLMTKALIAESAAASQSGKFEFERRFRGESFANVVAVSFSAFDETELLAVRKPTTDTIGFSYIGLRYLDTDSSSKTGKPKTTKLLAREFVKSLRACRRIGVKKKRWESVIATIQADPVFRAAQLSEMIEQNLSEPEGRKEVLDAFMDLSSGHKIVLLTLTRLVETVEERTLVLIDEPEAHLHPPLLSAMTRAISDLMVKRNGVAIVATHSPVILQEVPKSCVWILDRMLSVLKAERPSIETFAESVGILSREVFKLELSQSGYHRLLTEVSKKYSNYEHALRKLEGQLGSEGKAVLRAMYLDAETEL